MKHDIKNMKARMAGIDDNAQRLLELEVTVAEVRNRQPTPTGHNAYVQHLVAGCYHVFAVSIGDCHKWSSHCT